MMMGTWDIRLIGASYSNSEGELAIHLFGKTREGESVGVKYVGFEPYFYFIEPASVDALGAIVRMLEDDNRVERVEQTIELLHKDERRKCRKVVATFPWLVPDIRRAIQDRGSTVLAADIPFHFRFMYDMDLGSCIRVYGEEFRDNRYKTDIVVKAEKLESIKDFHPDLTILSFDVETSLKESKIYCLCCVLKKGGKVEGRHFVGDADERGMIEGFSKFIEESDPDVITGYNIDGFDIPQLIERAKALGLPSLQWGRFPGELSQYNNRFWWTEGRIIIDAWWAVKKTLKPKQETLNAVSKLLLGEEKHDVDPKKMDDEWKGDREKVMNYCEWDSQLALKVLEKVAILRGAWTSRQCRCCPWTTS